MYTPIPPEHLEEITPGHVFVDGDDRTLYWIRDGLVFYRDFPIRNADAASFRFYVGHFAKDRKYCYYQNTRLKEAVPADFKALNYAFYTDSRNVWSKGTRVADADVKTFVVCDAGSRRIDESDLLEPHGYAKDERRVYFQDGSGTKAIVVRKANPASFISLGDGWFGKDDRFIFCCAATIAKANYRSWQRLGSYYSKDDSRVFYFNRVIVEADIESFRVIPSRKGATPFARDKNHFYWTDKIIDEDGFGAWIWDKDAQPDVPGDAPKAARS